MTTPRTSEFIIVTPSLIGAGYDIGRDHSQSFFFMLEALPGDFKSERFGETSETERFTCQYVKITSVCKFSHI